jgi:hypothetical protein
MQYPPGGAAQLFSGYSICTDTLETELRLIIDDYLLLIDCRRMIIIGATIAPYGYREPIRLCNSLKSVIVIQK